MLISWLTPNTDVQRLAGEMLGYASMLPLIGVWCFLLDGIFVGATRTADMRNLMLLSFAIYLAALAALLPWLGQAGLWIAHMIFFATRAVTLAWRYPVLARDADAER
jgi:MATE family multidrug resistance protein